MEEFVKNYGYRELIASYWSAMSRVQKRRYLFGMFLRFTGDFVWIFPPYFIGILVNLIANGGMKGKESQIMILVGLPMLLAIWKYFTHERSKLHVFHVAEALALEFWNKGLLKMYRTDQAWHEKESSGAKVQRIQKAGASADDALRMSVEMLVESTVNLVMVMLILSSMNFILGLLMIVFYMSYLLTARKMTKGTSEAIYRVNVQYESYQAVALESVVNVNTVKALGLASVMLAWVKKESALLYDTISLRIQRFRRRQLGLHYVREFYRQVMFVFIIYMIYIGQMELGMIVIFFNYFQKMTDSAEELGEMYQKMEGFRLDMARFEDWMQAPETQEEAGHKAFPKNWQHLELKDLVFQRGSKKIFGPLNAKILRGQKVGVVGLSGSGKSTFAKLLLKLYAPSKGGVFFDNLNVAEIRRENYLQHVAYVPQESELFHLSLAQNIAMSAKPNVELLRQVIQDSGLESLVMRLPDGLETLLGERGQRLSGGERQRVALARALYRQAPILILDEATSHLDEQTELHVQKALERSAHTMIVIAHRYSTLKNMDCIFHFHEDGFVRYNNLESFLRANSNFHAS